MQQPKEDVYRGWITWGPTVGESDEGRLARQRDMIEGEWREAMHPDGRLYFYHTATHERRWEPPAEGLYARRRFALKQFFAEKVEETTQQLKEGDAEAKAPRAAFVTR